MTMRWTVLTSKGHEEVVADRCEVQRDSLVFYRKHPRAYTDAFPSRVFAPGKWSHVEILDAENNERPHLPEHQQLVDGDAEPT